MNNSDSVFLKEISELRAFFEIPGLMFRVIQNGKLSFSADLGYQNKETCRLFDHDTVFPIASLTKMFTAVVIYRLHELGKLDLYSSIPDYLYDQGASDCKLVHLLSHSTVPSNNSTFIYDGERYGLLKTVIEQQSGMSLSEAFSTYVFEPAGLQEAYFLKEEKDVAALKGRLSILYNAEEDHSPGKYEIGLTAASGLVLTAGELCKFEQALHNGLLISKNSLNDMMSPARRPDGTHLPTGKGLFVQYLDNEPVIWSFGQEDSLGHLYIHLPNSNSSIFILSNSPRLTDPARLIYGDIRSNLFFWAFYGYIFEAREVWPWKKLNGLVLDTTSERSSNLEQCSPHQLVALCLARIYGPFIQESQRCRIRSIFKTSLMDLEGYELVQSLALMHLLHSLQERETSDRHLEYIILQMGIKLLKLEPTNPYIHYYMARCYLRSGRSVDCMTHFQCIFEQTKSKRRWYFVEACYELACLYEQEDPVRSSSYLHELIELNWNYCDLLTLAKELQAKIEQTFNPSAHS